MATEPTATVVAYALGSHYEGAVKFVNCGCDDGRYTLNNYLRCEHKHRSRDVALRCGEKILKRARQALAKMGSDDGD